MNPYDPQKAAQVWQRVQNQAAPPESLNPLILAQQETVNLCQRLSGPIAAQIGRTARQQIQCLKGMHWLIHGEAPKLRIPAPGPANDAALRKCYLQMMRCLREYEKRCDDPEYGPVFRALAGQQQENCCRLLQYLGAQTPSGG